MQASILHILAGVHSTAGMARSIRLLGLALALLSVFGSAPVDAQVYQSGEDDEHFLQVHPIVLHHSTIVLPDPICL